MVLKLTRAYEIALKSPGSPSSGLLKSLVFFYSARYRDIKRRYEAEISPRPLRMRGRFLLRAGFMSPRKQSAPLS